MVRVCNRQIKIEDKDFDYAYYLKYMDMHIKRVWYFSEFHNTDLPTNTWLIENDDLMQVIKLFNELHLDYELSAWENGDLIFRQVMFYANYEKDDQYLINYPDYQQYWKNKDIFIEIWFIVLFGSAINRLSDQVMQR